MFEKGEFVKTELETAEVLNKFFSNIVNNLEISKYCKYESFIDNIEHQTLRAILKHKNHSSIIAIQNNFKGREMFYFRKLEKQEIHILNTNKASEYLTFPPNLLTHFSPMSHFYTPLFRGYRNVTLD